MTASPAPDDPLIGRTIGRCRLDAFLDEGRSAAVYRGVHLGLQRPVAVKILRPEAAALPEVVAYFEREAKAIARLDSENVLKVYDVVSDGDLHYMVMELLEGESVHELVTRQDRLSQIDALRIVRQAALGLAAAHARKIVHRDVKPSNLVVLRSGTVKVVDFGLALAGESRKRRVGTPHYVSPETAADGHAEPASDVYSLGITLFHLLVGQPPFSGMAVPDVLRAHLAGDQLDLASRREGLSRSVLKLFGDMTKHDPLVRPSAAEVVAQVDAIGGKKLVRTRSLSRRARPNVLGRVAAALGLLLVVAGVGFLLLQSRLDTPGTTPVTPPDRADAPDPEPAPPGPTPGQPTRIIDRDLAELDAEEKRMEEEAWRLLRGVEKWARAHWRSRADTPEALRLYRDIAEHYKDTEAGREAAHRIEEIEADTRHPHPDREWSPPEDVAAAKAAWTKRAPEVAALVEDHRYEEAKEFLPPLIHDASGELELELAFQHALLEHLVLFPARLDARLAADPELSRRLETRRGRGRVEAVDAFAITVLLDGVSERVPWTEVETAVAARFAIPAFEDAEIAEALPLLAFCVAHDLREAFFQASLLLDTAGAAPDDAALLRTFRKRMGTSGTGR